MAALESAVNSFENFVQFTPAKSAAKEAMAPAVTVHPAAANNSGDFVKQMGEAVAANAEQQCRVNEALIARVLKLERALNETNAVVRRLCEESRARG
jgi:hypothetical protein